MNSFNRRIHYNIAGAWGSATADNKFLQLRALDWNVDGPFKDFPQITVYHSTNASEGHGFANVGWTGWLGSITGFSEKKVGVSEIGVAFPDATFGNESTHGIPFTFILRDILQFDGSLTKAMSRISTANRTCDLILGVGDGNLPVGEAPFRGVQYSHDVANFFVDTDMQPVNDTWHPRIQDMVYYGAFDGEWMVRDDWTPSFRYCS